MRVYNLTTAQFGLSNLALRRIKVTRFSELNDPFELLAVDLADFDHRVGFVARKRMIDDKEGLVCFTHSWRDPLLWSHYGESHYGLCLGFDVPDDQLRSVSYVKGLHKVDVKKATIDQTTIDHLLDELRFTKFDGWSYENEFRMIVNLHNLASQSGLFFLPFSKDLILREVILGPRCDLPIEAIRKLIEPLESQVKVVKARIAYKKFAVVEDRTSRVAKRKA